MCTAWVAIVVISDGILVPQFGYAHERYMARKSVIHDNFEMLTPFQGLLCFLFFGLD